MKIGRSVNRTVLVLVAAGVLFDPAAASAGSLLSGYGGPGDGSQAILGSALVAEPPTGGGGAGATPLGSTAAEASLEAPAGAAVTAPSGARSLPSASRRTQHARAGRSSGKPRVGDAASSSRRTAATSPARSAQAAPLGFSPADLLELAIALAALALTAALTVRATRGSRSGDGLAAQGISRANRLSH
jgi:hypothetical protein